MRRALPLLAAVLLAACATPPRPAPGSSAEPAWTTGRISVRIAASVDQTAQSMTGGFELRGTGEAGELRLNSPFGSRLASARWAPGEAVLGTPEGERRFENLDSLSRAALGEALPLAALPDWLAGRPWPGALHRVMESGFEQLGWIVARANRTDGLIEARRPAAPEVLVKLRLDADIP